MIRLLTSVVWGGVPKGVYQEYGPTTVPGEPYSYRDKSLFHCGIDVGDLGIGTPLYAARGGVVVNVGWGQLGIQVGAEVDWYIHIDSSHVGVGAPINRGNLVAYSGGKVPAGGVLYGAHLHFEVQTAPPPVYNRVLTSVDPESVLTALFGGGGGVLKDLDTQEHGWLENVTNEALATVTELRGKGANSKLDIAVGPNGLGGGQLDRIEKAIAVVLAAENAEAAQALADVKGLQTTLAIGFADLKATLIADLGQAVSDLKTALAALPAGSDPASAAAIARLEAALKKAGADLAGA